MRPPTAASAWPSCSPSSRPTARAVAHRRLHGRRLVRLGARRLPRRDPRRPARLALVLRRHGHPRPRPRRALPRCSSTTRSSTRHQRPDDVADRRAGRDPGERAKLRTLFSTPSVICAYVGSGLQLFIAGSLFAWLPSYLNRAYGLAPDKAAGIAADRFILLMGVGMIVCGMVTDRLSPHRRRSASGRRPSSTPRSRWSSSASGSPCTRAAPSCCCWRSASSSPPAPPARPARWSPT